MCAHGCVHTGSTLTLDKTLIDEWMNECMNEGIFTLFCTTHSRLSVLPCLFAPVYEGCFFHRKKNINHTLKNADELR